MQLRRWDDLRYLLAAARGGTLRAAGTRLGVDPTTVARRLAALERAWGCRLVRPDGKDALRLTPAGERAVARGRAVEEAFERLGAEISGADAELSGTVRLTSVPILVNRALAPAAGRLRTTHAALDLELLADARNLDLGRGEADLALRLARPVTGGSALRIRKIATLAYAAYARRGIEAGAASELPWIGYDASTARLPQARWIASRALERGEPLARLRVGDAETALEAVAAGCGRSLLPELVADRDPRLQRLEAAAYAAVPSRELWLLARADAMALAKTRAVVDWVQASVAALARRPRAAATDT